MTYLVVDETGSFNQVRVLRFTDRLTAEGYAFEVVQDKESAYVVESELDLIKHGFSGGQLLKLFATLSPEENGDLPKKFESLDIARRRVFMRLADVAVLTEYTPKSKADVETEAETKALAEATQPQPEGDTSTMPAKKSKSKKKVTNGTGKKRETVLTVTLPPNLIPAEDVKCGTYIRSLVMMGKGTEDILKLVKKHYPKSTAKVSDVSWNRGKLKAAGKKVPEAPRASE